MRAAIVAAACSTALLGSPAFAQLSSEQWILRQVRGESSPVAVFLSWDYSAVLFRAHCDAEAGELVVQYYGGDERPTTSTQMALQLDQGEIPLETNLLDGVLEGRLTATGESAAMIAASGNVDIEAPNDMGEPWHTGSALPLKELARRCVASPGS